jgi:hypothetical protein
VGGVSQVGNGVQIVFTSMWGRECVIPKNVYSDNIADLLICVSYIHYNNIITIIKNE